MVVESDGGPLPISSCRKSYTWWFQDGYMLKIINRECTGRKKISYIAEITTGPRDIQSINVTGLHLYTVQLKGRKYLAHR